MKTHTKAGNPTAYGYACGYEGRVGSFSVWREHGCYHAARHPSHPQGWKRVAARTLAELRKAIRA